MGYVDPLGRFIRDPDVDSLDSSSSTSLSMRNPLSKPIQFLSNLLNHDQTESVRYSTNELLRMFLFIIV
jgi:nitrate reductase beta subunit